MERVDFTQYGGLRMEILYALRAADKPMDLSELLTVLGIGREQQESNKVRQVLHRARLSGEVQRVQRGRYVYSGKPVVTTGY